MKCCGYCVKIFTNDKYRFCPYCGGKVKDYIKGDWKKEIEQKNIEYSTTDNTSLNSIYGCVGKRKSI